MIFLIPVAVVVTVVVLMWRQGTRVGHAAAQHMQNVTDINSRQKVQEGFTKEQWEQANAQATKILRNLQAIKEDAK